MEKRNEQNERRQSERHEARIKIRFASPDALQKEYASNISKGGMFINTRKPHPLRSLIKFNLILPVSEEVVELTGEVVHVIEPREGLDPSKVGIGVQFLDLDADKRRIIENYIKKIGKNGEYHEEEVLPDKAEKNKEKEDALILKEALRSATKRFQEMTPEQLAQLKRKIRLFYAERANMNYYDMLGVRYNAPPSAIREAYHKLSMDFHPDRHHARLPPELRPQIEDIFGKINKAYKTLRDIQARLEYDVSVGNWQSVPGVPQLSEENKRNYFKRKEYIKRYPEKVQRAQELFEEAQSAFSAGDNSRGISQLKLAYTFDPFNAEIIRALEEQGIKVKKSAQD